MRSGAEKRVGSIQGRTFTRRDLAVLALPLTLVLGLFLLWPVAFGLFASLTDYSPFQARPRFIGLANYAYILSDGSFAASFRTIAVFSLATVPAELVIGFAVALLLREPFRGRTAVRVTLLIPWLISPVANGVMWHFLYSSAGGIIAYFCSWLGLAAPPSPLGMRGYALPAVVIAEIWRTAPLVSFLLLPGLLSIPRSLWEQATLEGASVLFAVRRLVLPWIRPLLLTVSMLLVGWAMGTFDTILILTHGGPGTETLTPALYSFQKAYAANNWGIGASSAWFIVVVVVLAGAVYISLARREDRP